MRFEEPKVELIKLDLLRTGAQYSSNCIEDHLSSQGGSSCIGNQDHSNGEGCHDTAPSIAG